MDLNNGLIVQWIFDLNHCTQITLPTSFSNNTWIDNKHLWIDGVAAAYVTKTNTTLAVSCSNKHCKNGLGLFAIGF